MTPCGETGIRTPETLLTLTRFPGVPLQLREHLSCPRPTMRRHRMCGAFRLQKYLFFVRTAFFLPKNFSLRCPFSRFCHVTAISRGQTPALRSRRSDAPPHLGKVRKPGLPCATLPPHRSFRFSFHARARGQGRAHRSQAAPWRGALEQAPREVCFS